MRCLTEIPNGSARHQSLIDSLVSIIRSSVKCSLFFMKPQEWGTLYMQSLLWNFLVDLSSNDCHVTSESSRRPYTSSWTDPSAHSVLGSSLLVSLSILFWLWVFIHIIIWHCDRQLELLMSDEHWNAVLYLPLNATRQYSRGDDARISAAGGAK